MLRQNTHQRCGKCAGITILLLAVYKDCNAEFQKINKETLTCIRVKICHKIYIDTYYAVLYLTNYASITLMKLRYGCLIKERLSPLDNVTSGPSISIIFH